MSLIITGVIDGPLAGGTPKAIELFALADIPDLSIYGVGSASNGGGTDGQEFTLSGLASAGDFIYISFEATQFQNFLGFAPTFTSATAPNINGNDAIELFQNGTVIDVFGDINTDGTGEPWEYMDGWAYRRGNTTPDGTTFNLANWTFSSPNALDGETTNVSAANPFPTGVFNSNVAPVLSGNATFSAINEDIAAASNTGNTVEELVSALITDIDFDPEGIAVTSVDNTNGTWQYSLDGGTTWLNFGALSANNAITLGATSIYNGYETDPNQDAPAEQGLLAFASVELAIPPTFPTTEAISPIGVTVDTTGNDDIYAGYSNFTIVPGIPMGAPPVIPYTFVPVSGNFPVLDSETGYTLSFNAQVLEETVQAGRPRAGFSVIAVSQDATKAIELAFQDGQIFAQALDGTNQFVASTTDFTTAHDVTQETQYSLQVQGIGYTLFANGSSILTGTLQDYTSGNTNGAPNPYSQSGFIFLGDDTTSAQGKFRINQIAIETPTRIRFQPNADYNGSANIQFRAWDTTDGSSNGQTGVDASLTGGINPFSNTLGTGTIAVTPQGGGGTPGGVPGGDSANAIFNFEQWVSLVAIRTGQVYQSALVDFNVEIGGIRIAPLFDEADYLSENPDVAIAVQQGIYQYGFEHFVLFGLNEGRTPSNWFDEQYYLAQNADVAAAVSRGQTTAIAHFLQIGHRENRDPSAFFDASDYLLKNPDVKAAVDAGLLDSGFEHYLESGAEEGRLNGLLFEESFYLKQNPDVATAVQRGEFALGLYHFLAIGQSEGRDPSSLFDQSAYLARYGDVAAAVAGGGFASGFEHYVLFGRAEGRITV